jgi:hypothetical protein
MKKSNTTRINESYEGYDIDIDNYFNDQYPDQVDSNGDFDWYDFISTSTWKDADRCIAELVDVWLQKHPSKHPVDVWNSLFKSGDYTATDFATSLDNLCIAEGGEQYLPSVMFTAVENGYYEPETEHYTKREMKEYKEYGESESFMERCEEDYPDVAHVTVNGENCLFFLE